MQQGVRQWTREEREEVLGLVLDGMAEGVTLQETVEREQRRLSAREPERYPGKLTPGLVRGWLWLDEEWFRRYQRAKALLGQAYADEAVVTARESTSSTTAMDRVRIETLKWAAAKANPVEFGEKQTVEHQGAQTLQVRIVEEEGTVRNVQALKAAESAALERAVVGSIAPSTKPVVQVKAP